LAEIHYLPGAREASVRLLERAVSEAIADHPDPRVAARWAAMARETVSRWPCPPTPSLGTLEFDGEDDLLDPPRRARLVALLERWVDSYFDDVRDQMMEMHGEILALQRRVAEQEAEHETEHETWRRPTERRSSEAPRRPR